MNEIFPNIFELFPTKPTPKKYRTFLIRREQGNLLIPCFSTNSTVEVHFNSIGQHGGLSKQLLGDSHFRSAHCDEVADRFGAPLYCSDVESPDVKSVLKNVVTFPFEHHAMADDIEVIPTPGHRDGGVCYFIKINGKGFLFAGDFIWHDGTKWIPTAKKAGKRAYDASLNVLSTIEFDVLVCNTIISNPVCYIEFMASTRSSFIAELRTQLTMDS